MPKRLRSKLTEQKRKMMRTDLSSAISDPSVSPYFNSLSDPNYDGSEKVDRDPNIAGEGSNTTHDETVGKKSQEQHQLLQLPSSSSSSVAVVAGNRLLDTFYDQESITLAKALLGQVMVRIVNGSRVSGIIVETESYLGGEDVASHSHNGKRTPRNEPMYMKSGTSYVYPIYGMYYCFNVSSKGDGSCVLVRALEPLEGMDIMAEGRNQKRKNTTPLKTVQLCNGPSKLCQALNMTKDSCNKVDLPTSSFLWMEAGSSIPEEQIIIGKRIGIESAGEEWANKPLRFYVADNKYVSVYEKKKKSGKPTSS